ncbi:MAG: MerR family transcriptional regulator [Pyrinomonadaceae bacterium]
MAQEAVVIPDKLYFKIGEVCDLVGVQAHVLRYWETEFSMLSPQKNKSGQRSYRRRDVEMALRIKQLLYKEMFTIAGARKKLQSEQREGSKPNDATDKSGKSDAPTLFDSVEASGKSSAHNQVGQTLTQREALKTLTTNLHELRDMLKSSAVS